MGSIATIVVMARRESHCMAAFFCDKKSSNRAPRYGQLVIGQPITPTDKWGILQIE